MDNYIGLHQRHDAILQENKLHLIEGSIMAISIILTPIIAIFVIKLIVGH